MSKRIICSYGLVTSFRSLMQNIVINLEIRCTTSALRIVITNSNTRTRPTRSKRYCPVNSASATKGHKANGNVLHGVGGEFGVGVATASGSATGLK